MSNLSLYTFFQKLANAPEQAPAGGAQAPATPNWQHSIGNLGKQFMELMRANPQYAGSIFGALLGRSIMNSVSDRDGGSFGHLGLLGGGALGYLAGHSLKVPDVEQTAKTRQEATRAAAQAAAARIKSEGEVSITSGLLGATGGTAAAYGATNLLDWAARKPYLGAKMKGAFDNAATGTPSTKGGKLATAAQIAMLLGGMGYGAYQGFKPKQVVTTNESQQ